MRNQKYYKKRIMERFLSSRDMELLYDKYRMLSNYKKQGTIGSHYLGYLLESCFTAEGWEEFKEDYENAKSPTVNNLPRGGGRATLIDYTGDNEREEIAKKIKYAPFMNTTTIKLFGIKILEIERM